MKRPTAFLQLHSSFQLSDIKTSCLYRCYLKGRCVVSEKNQNCNINNINEVKNTNSEIFISSMSE